MKDSKHIEKQSKGKAQEGKGTDQGSNIGDYLELLENYNNSDHDAFNKCLSNIISQTNNTTNTSTSNHSNDQHDRKGNYNKDSIANLIELNQLMSKYKQTQKEAYQLNNIETDEREASRFSYKKGQSKTKSKAVENTKEVNKEKVSSKVKRSIEEDKRFYLNSDGEYSYKSETESEEEKEEEGF
mmetsp:Transcript_17743/g.18392  ORF Transcript_17743/g.18392 Transcript_17743/m.18392 type:complete len:184 (+) Transcript_17743:22-573(+)